MHTIVPASSALLVIDYQPAILRRVGDAEALLGRAVRAIDLVRGAGLHLGHVRVAFEPADVANVPATNTGFSQAAAAMPPTRRTPSSMSVSRRAPATWSYARRESVLFPRPTSTHLRNRKVTTLLLAGVSTSGVVLSTLTDGADRDYRLIVLSDACADPDEEVHRVLLTKVFTRRAQVITIDELAKSLG